MSTDGKQVFFKKKGIIDHLDKISLSPASICFLQSQTKLSCNPVHVSSVCAQISQEIYS